jgi:hypothetical protein
MPRAVVATAIATTLQAWRRPRAQRERDGAGEAKAEQPRRRGGAQLAAGRHQIDFEPGEEK